MSIATYGTNGVDWENRVDFDRLRMERLARLKAEIELSSLGSLLTFDFNNIRYMTSTHIGTWAMDKMIRFSILPRGGEPILWDFGSAAKHHTLQTPWLDKAHTDASANGHAPHHDAGPLIGSRAGISTLRGAISPSAGQAESVANKIYEVLKIYGLEN